MRARSPFRIRARSPFRSPAGGSKAEPRRQQDKEEEEGGESHQRPDDRGRRREPRRRGESLRADSLSQPVDVSRVAADKPRAQSVAVNTTHRLSLSPGGGGGGGEGGGGGGGVSGSPRPTHRRERSFRKSRKEKLPECGMNEEDFPSDVRAKIFALLPASSLCCCVFVCKLWQTEVVGLDAVWQARLEADFALGSLVGLDNALSPFKSYAQVHGSEGKLVSSRGRGTLEAISNGDYFTIAKRQLRFSKPITLMVMGDEAQGKTLLASQFAFGRLPDEYDPTIEDSYEKHVVVDGVGVDVVLVDTGGDPRVLADMADGWVRRADGFVIVYDRYSPKAAQRLNYWTTMIQTIKSNQDVPIVIGANSGVPPARRASSRPSIVSRPRLAPTPPPPGAALANPDAPPPPPSGPPPSLLHASPHAPGPPPGPPPGRPSGPPPGPPSGPPPQRLAAGEGGEGSGVGGGVGGGGGEADHATVSALGRAIAGRYHKSWFPLSPNLPTNEVEELFAVLVRHTVGHFVDRLPK